MTGALWNTQMPESTNQIESKSSGTLAAGGESGESFLLSAVLFRIGLALVTFEQVRPFGMMLSDYFFFLSILAFLPSFKSRLLRSRGSGILFAGVCIVSGSCSVSSARR